MQDGVDIRSLGEDSATWRFELFDLRQFIERKAFVENGIPDRIFDTVEEICRVQTEEVASKPTFQHMIQDILLCRLLTYFLGEVNDIDGFEKEYYRLFKAPFAERLRMISLLTPEVRKQIKTDLEPLRAAYIERTRPALSSNALMKIITKHNTALGSGGCVRIVDSLLSAIGPSVLAEQMVDRQRSAQKPQNRAEESADERDEADAFGADVEDEEVDPRRRSRGGASTSTRTPSSSSRRGAATSEASGYSAFTPSKFTLSPPYNSRLAGKTPAQTRTPPRRTGASTASASVLKATTSRPILRSPPARQYETQAAMSDSTDSDEVLNGHMEVDEEEPVARPSRRTVAVKRSAGASVAHTDDEGSVLEQSTSSRRRAKVSQPPPRAAPSIMSASEDEEERPSQASKRSGKPSTAVSSRPTPGPREIDSEEDDSEELTLSFKKTSAKPSSAAHSSTPPSVARSTAAPTAKATSSAPVDAGYGAQDSILDTPPATQEPNMHARDDYRWNTMDDNGYDDDAIPYGLPDDEETTAQDTAMNGILPASQDADPVPVISEPSSPPRHSSPKRTQAKPSAAAAPATTSGQGVSGAMSMLSGFGDISSIAPKSTAATTAANTAINANNGAQAKPSAAAPVAATTRGQGVSGAMSMLSGFGDISRIAPKSTAAVTAAATNASNAREAPLPPRNQPAKRRTPGNTLALDDSVAEEIERIVQPPTAKRVGLEANGDAAPPASNPSTRPSAPTSNPVAPSAPSSRTTDTVHNYRPLPASIRDMRPSFDSHTRRDNRANDARTRDALELLPVVTDPNRASLPTMQHFDDLEASVEHAPLREPLPDHHPVRPMVRPAGPDGPVGTKTRLNPAFNEAEDTYLLENFESFFDWRTHTMQWARLRDTGIRRGFLAERTTASVRDRVRTFEKNLKVVIPRYIRAAVAQEE